MGSSTLAECLAAYLFFLRTLDTASNKPAAATERVKTLVETVTAELSAAVATVNIPLQLTNESRTKVPAYNIYLNILKHDHIRDKLNALFNAASIITPNLDLDKNFVHKVLEYTASTKCILSQSGSECGGMLSNTYRTLSGTCKGSICIIHDTVKGPQIGITHVRSCSICKARYQPQRINTTAGDIIHLPPQKGLHQYSTSLFFHENIFIDAGNLLHENGLSGQSYARMYNRRFERIMKSIEKVLVAKS